MERNFFNYITVLLFIIGLYSLVICVIINFYSTFKAIAYHTNHSSEYQMFRFCSYIDNWYFCSN